MGNRKDNRFTEPIAFRIYFTYIFYLGIIGIKLPHIILERIAGYDLEIHMWSVRTCFSIIPFSSLSAYFGKAAFFRYTLNNDCGWR